MLGQGTMEETEGTRLEMGASVGGACLGGSRSEHMIKIDTIGRTGHFEGSPTRLGGAGGGTGTGRDYCWEGMRVAVKRPRLRFGL